MRDSAADGGTLRRHWRLRFPQHSAEQLFALVSDIESYPRFVPGCIATRILERRADGVWLVDNVFGFGPLRQRFHTLATPEPPQRLVIRSEDGPWRRFAMIWNFIPDDSIPDGAGCRVEVEVELGFRSPLLAALARTALPSVEPRIINAFEARAARLCDSRQEDTA